MNAPRRRNSVNVGLRLRLDERFIMGEFQLFQLSSAMEMEMECRCKVNVDVKCKM